MPRPVQPGGPPVHLGGSSDATWQRVASRAHGWYGFLTTLDSTESAIAKLQQAVADGGRPEELGEVQISVSPAEPVDRDLIRRYEDLGVDRLVLVRDYRDVAGGPTDRWTEAVLRFLEETPELLDTA